MTSVLSNGFVNGLMMKLKQRRIRNVLIGLYVLLILGLSATVRADDTKVHFYPIQQAGLQSFQGQILVDQGHVLLATDKGAYELRGRIVGQLVDLNGTHVLVTGFEYKHRVGPVVHAASFNPLQDDADMSLAVAPVVFVASFEILH